MTSESWKRAISTHSLGPLPPSIGAPLDVLSEAWVWSDSGSAYFFSVPNKKWFYSIERNRRNQNRIINATESFGRCDHLHIAVDCLAQFGRCDHWRNVILRVVWERVHRVQKRQRISGPSVPEKMSWSDIQAFQSRIQAFHKVTRQNERTGKRAYNRENKKKESNKRKTWCGIIITSLLILFTIIMLF